MSYSTKNAEILALFTACGKDLPEEGTPAGDAVEILQTICDSQSHTIPEIEKGTSEEDAESKASEIFDALEEIETHLGEDDFTLDFDGAEYRLISDSDIWEIYKTELENLIDECYPEVKKALEHNWIAISIDMEQTAKNAFVDGYGHHFSSYDGSEETAARYYIFRTN